MANIPSEFKPLFWDTQFEKLDLVEDKRYIIARLYNYGTLETVDWVNATYNKSDIEDTARNFRDLKPLVANYFRQQCDLEEEDMAYYRTMKNTSIDFWRKRA